MTRGHDLDIAGLKTAYAARELTVAAVTANHLARIERMDPSLRAFIEVDRGGALRAAAESDARIAAGALRALEGVPVAVKANIAVAGLDWNAGMEARRGTVAQTDAQSVSRLRAAGGIVLGTLNMHEAAFGATTDNPWFGRAHNPHRAGYTPGGSSGGSGAAVAAGLCVAALGTDTLGSIRIPAAYNGVYGLKPTHGAISTDGLVPLADDLDAIGPLARSLDDLQAVLQVLMPVTAAQPPLQRLLILDSFGDVDCEPAVVDAYQRAIAALSELPLTRLTLPHDAARVRLAGFIVAGRELMAHLRATRAPHRDNLSVELTKLLHHAEKRTAADFSSDQEVLSRTRTALRDALGKDGVLLIPTAPQTAFEHTARPPITQAAFTALANIAGVPALSIPAGRGANGLPLAVQLVGPPGSEAALIALARRLDDRLRGYAPPHPNE